MSLPRAKPADVVTCYSLSNPRLGQDCEKGMPFTGHAIIESQEHVDFVSRNGLVYGTLIVVPLSLPQALLGSLLDFFEYSIISVF